MDKSYVSMEQQQCVICTTIFDTGNILLDTKIRNSFERYTVTGLGICPACQVKIDEGFVVLVEIDPTKSNLTPEMKTIKHSLTYRTGTVVYVKKEAFEQLCNIPIPNPPILYMDTQTTAHFQQLFNSIKED